jgi:hypothetical protein
MKVIMALVIMALAITFTFSFIVPRRMLHVANL